jgi:hypothetical protein
MIQSLYSKKMKLMAGYEEGINNSPSFNEN